MSRIQDVNEQPLMATHYYMHCWKPAEFFAPPLIGPLTAIAQVYKILFEDPEVEYTWDNPPPYPDSPNYIYTPAVPFNSPQFNNGP